MARGRAPTPSLDEALAIRTQHHEPDPARIGYGTNPMAPALQAPAGFRSVKSCVCGPSNSQAYSSSIVVSASASVPCTHGRENR